MFLKVPFGADRSFSNVPFVTFKPDLHMVKVRSMYICHGNFNSLMNAHQQCQSNLIPLMNLKQFYSLLVNGKNFLMCIVVMLQ